MAFCFTGHKCYLQGEQVQNETGCMKRSPFLLCFTRLTQDGSEVSMVSLETDSLARERKDLCTLAVKKELI